ncbi:MAG: radical SAM protein, partial [Treponema sp.]|nr:radical SAM protein [Treponema sp.]
MRSVSFYTLGCKLNQLETEAVAESFRAAGFAVLPWEDAADLRIINTCTVTSKAEQKARRILRLALKKTPVIVTGCYAQLDGRELSEAGRNGGGDRLFILPGALKDGLLDLPARLNGSGGIEEGIRNWMESRDPGKTGADGGGGENTGAFRFNPRDFSFHSRAFLKIQDGCNSNCAYCRVPLARGKSVSLEAAEVLARLKALEERGFAEAVLTGVNITQYSCPGKGQCGLGGLLELLLGGTRRIALRLSSLEPNGACGPLEPGFLSIVADSRIRPHFHLSVQSGSAKILSAMGRPYTPGDIRDAVAALRGIRDDPFLACDIITGFPGEEAEQFEETWGLCGDLDFAWIHPFPYSPRRGTRAFSLGPPVNGKEVLGRMKRLLE